MGFHTSHLWVYPLGNCSQCPLLSVRLQSWTATSCSVGIDGQILDRVYGSTVENYSHLPQRQRQRLREGPLQRKGSFAAAERWKLQPWAGKRPINQWKWCVKHGPTAKLPETLVSSLSISIIPSKRLVLGMCLLNKWISHFSVTLWPFSPPRPAHMLLPLSKCPGLISTHWENLFTLQDVILAIVPSLKFFWSFKVEIILHDSNSHNWLIILVEWNPCLLLDISSLQLLWKSEIPYGLQVVFSLITACLPALWSVLKKLR